MNFQSDNSLINKTSKTFLLYQRTLTKSKQESSAISILLVAFLLLINTSLFSQFGIYSDNGYLIDNGFQFTIPASDPATYEDLKIPENTTYGGIRLWVKGADGGRKNPPSAGDSYTRGGGEGAYIWGTFEIGTDAGQIPPGSTLRFIVGHHGEGTSSHVHSGGGGGGGTGVILIPPGEEENEDAWVILAVGGAGAGGGADCCVAGYDGDPGKGYDNPGDGSGGSTLYTTENHAGGGAFGDASPAGGHKGFPEGGRGSNGHADGGWGFGGGGTGDETSIYSSPGSGGGGGYTGGDTGNTAWRGEGGTSFMNTGEMNIFNRGQDVGGSDTSPDDGFVRYRFECLATITNMSSCPTEVPGQYNVQISFSVSESCSSSPFIVQLGSSPGITTLPGTVEFENVSSGISTVKINLASTGFPLVAQQPLFIPLGDNHPPTAICQDHTLDVGQISAIYTEETVIGWLDGGSTDNCSIASMSVSETDFGCDDLGANAIVLTVTDYFGNTSTCNATVTVIDSRTPTITCPSNITTSNDPGLCAAVVNFAATAADNCNTTISYSLSPGTTFVYGTTLVTATTTNNQGNTAGCSFTITVEDTELPQAVCQDISLQVGCTGNVSISPDQVEGGSTDNCGWANPLNVTPSVFNSGDAGANSVVLQVEDENANRSTCTATVTVTVNADDDVAPTTVCQNLTLVLDDQGNASITPEEVNNGSHDACGIASMTLSQSSFDCSDTGPNSVILTVTDNNGNVSSCQAQILVEDFTTPVAVCNDVTVHLDESGTGSLIAGDIIEEWTDNCTDSPPLSGSVTMDCSDVGTTMITQGFGAPTCNFSITVIDNVAPTALCQDVTVFLDASGNGSITPADVDNGSTDACGVASKVLSQSSFTCSGIGLNIVAMTVTDNNGNSSNCIANIRVEDNVAPNAQCQDASVSLDASGNGTLLVAQVDNGSSDACGIASMVLSQSTFDCADLGIQAVTLTVTDNNGNVSSCTSNASVFQNTSPSFICHDITVFLDASGTVTTPVGDVVEIVDDPCNLGTLPPGSLDFDCADVGTLNTPVPFGPGCFYTVTVRDNIAPDVSCQDLTVSLDDSGSATIQVSDFDNGSYDACGIASRVLSKSTFSCTDIGSNSILMTVTDNNGNVNSCGANVIVEDETAPTALCQDVTLQMDANGNGYVTTAEINNGSTDACGLASLNIDQTSFNCMDAGANTVTLTVMDNHANSSTCTAMISFEDYTQPSLSCAGDMLIDTDAGVCESTVQLSLPDNSDNCAVTVLRYRSRPVDASGNNLPSTSWSGWTNSTDLEIVLSAGIWKIQWQAKDAANNQRECDFLIEVRDTEAPTLVCKHPTISFNGEAMLAPDMIEFWDELGSSDNCGTLLPVDISPAQVTCDQLGTIVPVTLTVEDGSGNTAQCTVNATVGGLLCNWHLDSNGIGCADAEADYDPASAQFSLTSEGCYSAHHYRPTDPHGFIQTELCGDGVIIAQVTDVLGNGWAGISMRESNAPDAPMIQLMVDGNGLSRREVRTTAGGTAFVHMYQTQGKNWLKLQRSGQHFSAYQSLDGQNWEIVFATNIAMANCIQMGMITMNGSSTGIVTGLFENIQLNNGTASPLTTPQGVDTAISNFEPEQQTGQIDAYPNPTYGQVTLNFSGIKAEQDQLSVFNQQGQLIEESRIDLQSTTRLDLGGYDAGLYLLHLETEDGRQFTKKIIKN